VFPAPKNPAKPLGYLWAAWRATRERAAILLWAASRDEKIVTLVDDLRVGLDAESSVAECKAEAKRRGIELPSGLLDARIYDLRHTFASVGAAGGLSLPIIGRLLGHTNSKTTARYAHLGDDPLREATDKIGRVIAGAGKQGAGIVPINRGR
jgi:integrase